MYRKHKGKFFFPRDENMIFGTGSGIFFKQQLRRTKYTASNNSLGVLNMAAQWCLGNLHENWTKCCQEGNN
jgi:hypothetical protein